MKSVIRGSQDSSESPLRLSESIEEIKQPDQESLASKSIKSVPFESDPSQDFSEGESEQASRPRKLKKSVDIRMDQCGQENKLLKLAYQTNKFYGRSFAFQTKPKIESELKESQVSEMII